MKITPLTDLDPCPLPPYRGVLMRHVPALYLLSLVGSPVLDEHPELAGYIKRAIRQLKAEAQEVEAEIAREKWA